VLVKGIDLQHDDNNYNFEMIDMNCSSKI